MAGFLDILSANVQPCSSSNVILAQQDDNIKELETLNKIEIDQFDEEKLDTSKYYVKGLITTAYPSFKTKTRNTKKLVLKSSSSTESTHSAAVFIIGDDVNQCDILKPKDIIIIKGFSLEKPTTKEQSVQILVNLQNTEAKLWMIKHNGITTSQNKPVSSKEIFHLVNASSSPRKEKQLDFDNEFQNCDVCQDSNRPRLGSASSKEETSNTSNEQHKVLVMGHKKLRIIQQSPKVNYTKIADVLDSKNGQKVVNILSVVKYFKSPKKSKGNDYCMVIGLVDDSLSSAEKTFMCTIFSSSKELLPKIKSVGNIVRFQGINVTMFQGVKIGSGNPRHMFKWLVIDAVSDTPVMLSASPTDSYTLAEPDKKIIQRLKTWALLHVEVPLQRTLSQIGAENIFFNLSCQVVEVYEALDCLVITVWDGTTPKYQSTSHADIKKSIPTDSVALKKVSKRLTIDVHLFDEHSQSTLNPGDFITLVNVHAIPQTPQVAGPNKISFIVHKGTLNGRGVIKLTLDSREVQEIKEQIASSNDSGNQNQITGVLQDGRKEENRTTTLPRTLQTSCTITDYPSVQFTSIEALKMCSKVPNKFRCRVKATAYLPHDVKGFVRTCCRSCKTLIQMNSSSEESLEERTIEKETEEVTNKEKQKTSVFDLTEEIADRRNCYADCSSKETPPKCSLCQQETQLVYLFSLFIEDPTGILHVILFDSDVTHFFIKLPSPEEFLTSPDAQQMIRDSLVSITGNETNELTAENQPGGSRPWMECCVMSYNIDQVVFYRMFGTTLI